VPDQRIATLNTNIFASTWGNGATAATTLRFYWASGPSLVNKISLIDSKIFPSIAPGEDFHQIDSWILPTPLIPPAGATWVILVLDEDNRIAEQDRSDNLLAIQLSLDLLLNYYMISGPSSGPSYTYWCYPLDGGEWLPIRSTTAKLYWASGPSLADITSDTPIHTQPIQSPCWYSGTDVQLGSELQAEPPVGTTGLLLVLDPDQVLLDTDRTNNVKFQDFPPMDTYFESVGVENGGVKFAYVTDRDPWYDGEWYEDWVPARNSSVKLFWAQGSALDTLEMTSETPIYTQPMESPCVLDQSHNVRVDAELFRNPPPGTTCVLMVIDPSQARPDFDRTNNYKIISLDEILPKDGDGEVTSIKGIVTVTRRGVERPLVLNDPIFVDDIIQTKKGSYVKIRGKDESTFNCGENSVAKYALSSVSSGFQLIRGKLRAKILKKINQGDTPITPIKTKTVAMGVRGTEFEVAYQELNGVATTDVAVFEGIVDVTEYATGKITTLTAGGTLKILSDVSAPTASINGGWFLPDGSGGGTVVTFLPNGEFLLFRDGDSVSDPGGQDGMERGTYVWNEAAGTLSVTVSADTNGQWGFSHGLALQPNVPAVVGGTSLEFTVPGKGTSTFTRVSSAASPLIGSWQVVGGTRAGGVAVVTFLADGSYYYAEDGDPAKDPTGSDGGERGTFSWDVVTGAFSATPLVDTCGQWGLSHLGVNPTAVLKNSNNDLIFSGGNLPAPISFYRVNGTDTRTMPVISWMTPLAITYGTALSASQLNAKANVPGNMVYTPALDSKLPAGTQTLMATFTPTDTAKYAPAQNFVSLVVAMANQTITFPAPPALLYGDANYDLAANATSGMALSYVSSNPAVASIVNGNQLHVVGAGSVKITASQPGNSNWKPALAVARTLVIGKKPQTITYPVLTGHAMGDADFSPGATANSGLAVTYASSAPAVATIVAGKIHLVGKGTAVITASQIGSANWAAAPPVKQTLVVAVGSQSITFAPLPNKGVGDVDFAPVATASSGLAVSYVSSNTKVATIVAGKIHVVGNGTSTITAKQAGNASWTAAPDAAQTFTVGGKAAPVITWANPAAISYGKPLTATQLNAKANVPGTFAYSPATGAQLPVGLQSLSVTFTPNDQVKYNTAQKSVALTVNKTAATVTLAGLSQGYNGQPRVVTATTVPAGLKVVITYAGTNVAPVNAGSYPVVATIDDPNAAGTKAGALVVAKGNQTISFASLPALHVGDADYALTASAASGLPVSYASSNPAVATIAGGSIHAVSTGTAVITATQGGDPNWNAALPVKQTLTVPTDDQDIRAFYATMKSLVEKHDQAGFLNLFAPAYFHQGQNLAAQFSEPAFLATLKTFTFNISRITLTGSDAQVAGTATLTFNNGDPAKSWTEPDTIDKSPGLGWLRKTTDGWRVVGNQVRAAVHLDTGHNDGAGNSFFRVWAESSAEITGITFSGPGVQDTALDPDPDYGGYSAFVVNLPDPLPTVGTKYSFLVQFADSTQATYQDSVKSWVPKAPVITVTPGVASATIKWTNVSAAVPNASYYWVRVNGTFWQSDDLPLTRTSAVFNENGQAQGTLQSGQTYTAEVFIFNKSGDYAYRQLQFTMP
jgi:hypothetical protein